MTSVSLDHAAVLGADLASIAAAKAGVLRPGRPAVLGPQPPEALAVLEAEAARLGAPLVRVGREWRWEAEDPADPSGEPIDKPALAAYRAIALRMEGRARG